MNYPIYLDAIDKANRSLEKFKEMRRFLDEKGRPDAEIEVDGNVSIENAIKMRKAGANILVLGTAIQSKTDLFTQEDIQ